MAVTTNENFNAGNIDITHKPRRYQSEVCNNEYVNNESGVSSLSNAPQSVTIESAITYFTNNAVGTNANLYKRTASWLKEYRDILNNKGDK